MDCFYFQNSKKKLKEMCIFIRQALEIRFIGLGVREIQNVKNYIFFLVFSETINLI